MPNASGLVPDISLGVGGGQGQNPLGGAVGVMSEMMRMQLMANQNKLFQQEYTAKNLIGQNISKLGLEPGVAASLQDPNAAVWVPQVMNNLRQLEQTNLQIQGEKMKQGDTGMQLGIKALLPSVNDPSQLDASFERAKAILSPAAATTDLPVLDNMHKTLSQLAKDNPAQYKSVLNGVLTSADVTPAALENIFGKTSTRLNPQTGQQEAGVTVPSALGGGFAPASTGNPSATSALGPTQSQAEYNTKRAGDMAVYERDLDDRVYNGSVQRRNNDEIIAAAKEAQTGGGADAYMKLGQLLQAAGFKNDVVDKWANGSQPASQEIDKLSLTNVLGQLKQQLSGVGGSRINQQEFVQQENKNPNITTDPRAIVKIFNLWNSVYNKDKVEQKTLDQYKSNGGDITRWPTVWNNSDYMKNFAPTSEFTGEGVKGFEKTNTGQSTNTNNFSSPQSVKDAVRNGSLTHDQGADILSSQFGFKRRTQ